MTHLDPSRGPRVSPGGTRYYHVGYAIKMHWKNLFNFQWATKLPNMLRISKSWTVLISGRSCQFEFVQIHKVRWFLDGQKTKFAKKIDPIFCNFSKIAQNRPKSPKIVPISTMNLNWPDFANIKTAQLFEIHFINGDLAAIWKMNSFFSMHFKA